MINRMNKQKMNKIIKDYKNYLKNILQISMNYKDIFYLQKILQV